MQIQNPNRKRLAFGEIKPYFFFFFNKGENPILVAVLDIRNSSAIYLLQVFIVIQKIFGVLFKAQT